ncbi:MAG: hprA 1 [Planctomycetaceae bacterium]|nr:hprA 1 [Planctomycetaceae bacterium]
MRKMVIFPAVDENRLLRIREVAEPAMIVANVENTVQATHEIVDATAFFGKITPSLLKEATRLEWIQTATASLEHYVFPELVEHPCTLTNMRGLFSDVIADHVMGYVLCFARNLHHYLRLQAQARWEPIGGETARTDFVSGNGMVTKIDQAHMHLSDCTLGVVGVGHIGSEILRRATAFGMRVIGVDVQTRTVPGVLPEVWDLSQLPRLLFESDFVVIAAPHTPETYKMFRGPQFASMKASGILINIGRGAIVDLADLTAALQQQVIAGAALDVFEIEPLPADHPLWRMENVILTPHVAAASTHIAERHLETLLENTRRYLAGEPFITKVDKQHWF